MTEQATAWTGKASKGGGVREDRDRRETMHQTCWNRVGERHGAVRQLKSRRLRRGAGLGKKSLETGRTPWSEAGCNKPASLKREKAVEVVKNGEDGTRRAIGMVLPRTRRRVTVCESGVDRIKRYDGGAMIWNPKRGRQTHEAHRRSTSD